MRETENIMNEFDHHSFLLLLKQRESSENSGLNKEFRPF